MNPRHLFPALLVLFIGLRLAGFIDWAWWWVLAPAWVPLTLQLIAIGCILIGRALESPEARAARLLREFGDRLGRRR